MEKVKIVSFKQMVCWQKSMDLVVSIYKITKQLPSSEIYCLSSQVQRAAISIPSNIAEGFGRTYNKEKKQFYTIAYTSASELETQLEIIKRIYLKVELLDALIKLEEIQKMLRTMIRRLS